MSTENNELLDDLTFLMSQVTSDMSRTNQTYQELVDGLGLDEIRNDLVSSIPDSRTQENTVVGNASGETKLNQHFKAYYNYIVENQKQALNAASSIPNDFNQQYMLNTTHTSAKHEDTFERQMRLDIADMIEDKLLRADILNLDSFGTEQRNRILSEIQDYNRNLENLVKNYVRSGSSSINEYKNSYLRKTNIYLVKKYLETVIEKKLKQKYNLDRQQLDSINFRITDFNPSSTKEIFSFKIFSRDSFLLEIENNGDPIGAFSVDKKRFQIGNSNLRISKCKIIERYLPSNQDNVVSMAMQANTVKHFTEYYKRNNNPTKVLEKQLVNDSYSEYDRNKIKMTERVLDTIKMNRQLIIDLIQMYFNSNPVEVYATLNKIIIQETIEENVVTCERFINIAASAHKNLNEVVLNR